MRAVQVEIGVGVSVLSAVMLGTPFHATLDRSRTGHGQAVPAGQLKRDTTCVTTGGDNLLELSTILRTQTAQLESYLRLSLKDSAWPLFQSA